MLSQKKINKKFLQIKSKPLFGNNRSFSNRATKRKFFSNKQTFRIDGKKYFLPVKLFRTYRIRQQKSL